MLDLTYDTPKVRTIAGAKQDWELVIGMEVHAQVSSNAKLFSAASTKFGAEPTRMWPLWMRPCPACCPR